MCTDLSGSSGDGAASCIGVSRRPGGRSRTRSPLERFDPIRSDTMLTDLNQKETEKQRKKV